MNNGRKNARHGKDFNKVDIQRQPGGCLPRIPQLGHIGKQQRFHAVEDLVAVRNAKHCAQQAQRQQAAQTRAPGGNQAQQQAGGRVERIVYGKQARLGNCPDRYAACVAPGKTLQQPQQAQRGGACHEPVGKAIAPRQKTPGNRSCAYPLS